MNDMEKQQIIKGVGRRTRVLRLHLGLSEAEMAARIGISAKALRYWESGQRRSSRGMTLVSVKLGEEFNVSLDWLVLGTKGDLPVNDHQPITPDMKPIPRVRV